MAASLWLAAPAFAQTITGTDPVKIFILAGESNMHGKGAVSPATTPGTLDYIYANDVTGRYQFIKSGGSYVTRADVGIRGLVFSLNSKNIFLRVHSRLHAPQGAFAVEKISKLIAW